MWIKIYRFVPWIPCDIMYLHIYKYTYTYVNAQSQGSHHHLGLLVTSRVKPWEVCSTYTLEIMMEKACQPEIFHTKKPANLTNHLKPNLQIILFQWGKTHIKVVVVYTSR